MVYKPIGYFLEGNIWSGGKLLPPQKCSVILVDTGDRSLCEVADDENVRVLSQAQDWYTIKKSELVLAPEERP